MALVPAWDKRTGEPLDHLVPERWFGTPLAANLSRTDPTAPATPAPTQAPRGRDRDRKEA